MSMLELPSKTCPVCGTSFAPTAKEQKRGKKAWEARKYCCRSCAGQAHISSIAGFTEQRVEGLCARGLHPKTPENTADNNRCMPCRRLRDNALNARKSAERGVDPAPPRVRVQPPVDVRRHGTTWNPPHVVEALELPVWRPESWLPGHIPPRARLPKSYTEGPGKDCRPDLAWITEKSSATAAYVEHTVDYEIPLALNRLAEELEAAWAAREGA